MAFKQRNFRNKVGVGGDDEEDGPPTIRPPQHQPKKEQGAGAPKPAPIAEGFAGAKGDTKKDSKGSKLNLLSFEDDGDDPGFVPKKDSKKDKDKQRQAKLARPPVLPDLPTDTAPQTFRSTAGAQHLTLRLCVPMQQGIPCRNLNDAGMACSVLNPLPRACVIALDHNA
jgi:GC-rich sequence DNA-binding factor